jgi:hypothetical protein
MTLDWSPFLRYVRLACPKCGVSVAVLVGCTTWCTRCPGRPEMGPVAT